MLQMLVFRRGPGWGATVKGPHPSCLPRAAFLEAPLSTCLCFTEPPSVTGRGPALRGAASEVSAELTL